jgi:hypothetical protein
MEQAKHNDKFERKPQGNAQDKARGIPVNQPRSHGRWLLGSVATVSLGALFLGLGFYSNRPYILYAIPLGIGGLIWAALVKLAQLSWLRSFLWSLGVTIVLFIGFYFVVRENAPHNTAAYRAEVVGSIYSAQRTLSGFNVWYAHHSKFGETLSPVQLVLCLRIVNRQQVTSVVKDHSVDLQMSDGAMAHLLRMNLQYGQLFLGPALNPHVGQIVFFSDVRLGGEPVPQGDIISKVDVAGDALDTLLKDHPLSPGETVHGLALFEVPPDAMSSLGKGQMVITIEDTAGTRFIDALPHMHPGTPYEESTALEQARIRIIAEIARIEDFHRAYFSECYK